MKFQGFLREGIRLDLFDGGAVGGEGAAVAGQAGADITGETRAASSAAAGRGTGEKEVLYGKQPGKAPSKGKKEPPAAGETASKGGTPETDAAPDGKEAKRKAFLDMVSGKGEYKAQFDERVQQIINKRFGEVKGLEARLEAQKPIVELLCTRYGVTDADPQKLLAALEEDNSFFAQAAEEAGMSVEQYKRFKRMERENAALREAERRSKEAAFVRNRLQDWFRQGEEMKGDYPGFDLARETDDPQFLSMLRAGVPVRHAYEVIHMDEIKAGVARMQAKATEKQVVDGIRAKGARPAENGMASQSAFTIKDDPSKLTRRDRAEIVRRVARGETIRF